MTKKKTVGSRYNVFHLDDDTTKDGSIKIPLPVFYNVGVNVEDKNLYFVYLLREVNMLTNMLLAILHYKIHTGQCWPRTVVFSTRSRFVRYKLRFGNETKIEFNSRFRIMDAVYMSLYGPIPDLHQDKRSPTIFNKERKSAEIAM